jgi:4-hydroxy-3-polyprenylbenzoate decarboxylase
LTLEVSHVVRAEAVLPKAATRCLDLGGRRCETACIRAIEMPNAEQQTITVGVTGASGALYAQKTLALLEADARVARVHLVITETGLRLVAEELRISGGDLKQLPARILGGASQKIEVISNKDLGASIASGSHDVDAMIVIPCSMGTLGAIASGVSDDLVSRSADVMLKEGHKLVLCVRDTPFNRIHLENMLRVQRAGAVVMPAVPAFYHHPKTIDDLVTQYVCRVLAQIGLPQDEMYRWAGSLAAKKADA